MIRVIGNFLSIAAFALAMLVAPANVFAGPESYPYKFVQDR